MKNVYFENHPKKKLRPALLNTEFLILHPTNIPNILYFWKTAYQYLVNEGVLCGTYIFAAHRHC